MASYFNLTLDTTAPSGVEVKINGDEEKANSTSVVLTISCSDADTSGYQMKIWGTASAANETDALWKTFSSEKNITLPTGDGIKTVYVKVRDDVWNESATASDSIQLTTTVPRVAVSGPDVAKISKIDGKNASVISFIVYRSDISEFKVMVVESVNASHDSATNKPIPIAGGSGFSANCIPANDFTHDSTYLAGTNGVLFSEDECTVTIYGEDLEAASPGDGVKIVKVFAKDRYSGLWSV